MDYAKERLFLEEIVKKAADICLEYKKKGFKAENKKTGQATSFEKAKEENFNGDYVTEADLAVDQFLHKELLSHHPDFGWLSEESVTEDSWQNKESFYIVDPIDGTAQFVSGGSYSVSVGLMHKGKIVASAIATPAEGLLFSAELGGGFYVNGQKQEKPTLKDFKDQIVAVSCSEYFKGKWDLFKKDLNVKPVGSVANKLAHVAADLEQNLVVKHPLNSWDIAAGLLMVEEQGLLVTNIKGEELNLKDYLDGLIKGIMIGTPESLAKIESILKEKAA